MPMPMPTTTWLSRLKGVAVAVLAALGHATPLNAEDPAPLAAIFVNEFPAKDIDLYWENPAFEVDHPGRRRFEARIGPRGGWHRSETRVGHEFSYDIDGKRHFVHLPPGNAKGEQYIILAGDSEGYRVQCEVATHKSRWNVVEPLNILVKPYWAPRGAARFLELVRNGHYNGVAFHRVVPNHLAAFGIAEDYATRTKEREFTLWDDFPNNIKFEPGMLSFAGTGPDSRSTEIFVVMPGAPKYKLEKLGENSWEVPFAVIDGDVNKCCLQDIYSGYGDTPPLGSGPDISKIYEADGYTKYLKKKFPLIDYITMCYIVEEVDDLSEGEF